jgi:hypothetical protein
LGEWTDAEVASHDEWTQRLDKAAHDGLEDCGYNVGRECDCSAVGALLERVAKAGLVLVASEPEAPHLPMDPDPNAVEVAPGTWRHWGLYLRGA